MKKICQNYIKEHMIKSLEIIKKVFATQDTQLLLFTFLKYLVEFMVCRLQAAVLCVLQPDFRTIHLSI